MQVITTSEEISEKLDKITFLEQKNANIEELLFNLGLDHHKEVLFHLFKMQRIYHHLRNYADSYLEYDIHGKSGARILWANKSPMIITWIQHVNQEVNDFIELGFSNHDQYYSLSMEKRNRFIQQSLILLQTYLMQMYQSLPEIPKTEELAYHFYKDLHDLAQIIAGIVG